MSKSFASDVGNNWNLANWSDYLNTDCTEASPDNLEVIIQNIDVLPKYITCTGGGNE